MMFLVPVLISILHINIIRESRMLFLVNPNLKNHRLQHYPKHACSGENADNTNITYFTSHSNSTFPAMPELRMTILTRMPNVNS